jgi:hypothetical protein
MTIHTGLKITFGFETQIVPKKPVFNKFRCKEFGMLHIHLAWLGVYLNFDYWRGDV